MAQIKTDRIDGSCLRRTSRGYEADRIVCVTGLSGAAADRMRAAIDAPGMPRLGQAHPSIANLYVDELAARPDGSGAAVVTVHYRSRQVDIGDRPMIEIGTARRQATTEADRDGNRITVAYSATGDVADLKTQGARASVLLSQTTLRFIRTERGNPAVKARKYVGTVNRTRIFDGEAGTWLCTAIDGQSLDRGQTYQVTYEFQYDRQGWQPTVTYIDPDTNRPPPDPTEGIGTKTVSIYPETELKELGL